MKALQGLAVTLVLAGCASLGTPAEPGMSISEHSESCSGGGRQIVSEMFGVLVGECTAKPDEYVVFNDGVVTNIYTADEISEAMLSVCPEDEKQKCENYIRGEVAERTEIKRDIASNLLAARNQRIANSLGQMGSSLQATDNVSPSMPVQNSQPATGQSGSCRYNPATGRNQVCYTVDAMGKCFAWGTGC